MGEGTKGHWRDLYYAGLGVVGIAALVVSTVQDPPEAPLVFTLAFGLLSMLLKGMGVRIVADAEHSFVGVADLAALLVLGPVAGGWVAAMSTGIALSVRVYRRTSMSASSLIRVPLFCAGLKGLMALGVGWLFVHTGGRVPLIVLTPEIILAFLLMICAWFCLEHLGWGIAVLISGGWEALSTFMRQIWPYSLGMGFLPLPLALVLAVTMTRIGWAGFFLLAAMLVGTGWLAQRWSGARRELEERIEDMLTFGQVGQELAQTRLNVIQQANLVHRYIRRLIDPPDFFLGLLDPEQSAVRFVEWTQHKVPQSCAYAPITGAIEWLSRHLTPVLVRDFERQDDVPFMPPQIGRLPRSAAYVPLVAENRLTGVLFVQSPDPDHFSVKDLQALSAIANQAAISIENARLYEMERRRAAQLTAVADVGSSIATIVDLDRLLSTVVRLIQERFGYYLVQVFVVDPESDRVVFRAASREELECLWRQAGREITYEAGGIIAWVARHAEPLLVNDVSQEPLYVPDDLLRLPNTQAELAVPIRHEGATLGVLDVQSRELRAFGSEDVFTLKALADQLSIAIHVARLYAAEREESWISTVLLRVSEAISRLGSLEQVLETLTRLTVLLVGVSQCVIWLQEPLTGRLRARAAYGAQTGWGEGVLGCAVAPGQFPAFDQSRMRKVHRFTTQDDHSRLPTELQQIRESNRLLILPLISKDEFLGLLTVDFSSVSKRYADKIFEMLAGIAHQAAVAIDGTLVYAAQQVDAYVATSLLEVARAIGYSQDFNETLVAISRIAPMLVGVERRAIFLREEISGEYVLTHYEGMDEEEAVAFRDRFCESDEGVAAELERGQPVMVIHESLDEEIQAALRVRATLIRGTHSLLALPLYGSGVNCGLVLMEYRDVPPVIGERWLRILTGIASQTATAIENYRLREQELERERLEKELSLAREIQTSFLPAKLPELPGWEIATYWEAARQVGGDFYDLFLLSRDRLGIIVADVADKGVPAALFMALSRTLIKAIALDGRPVHRVLARANDLILADATTDMFVTVFYCQIDLISHGITYASAGHNPALLVSADGNEMRYLKTRGMPLGVIKGNAVEAGSVATSVGDVLVIYTDGVTEAINQDNESFGLHRLADAVSATRRESPQAIIEAIKNALELHVGDRTAYDDITMVVLQRVK